MKNRILVSVTLLVLAFTLGFFLGRIPGRQAVTLSPLPTQTRQDPTEAAAPGTEAPQSSFPLDINTADRYALTALPGIGDALAQRIIRYREEHGGFSRPEELLNVEGIGPGKLEAILDYITAGG